MDNNQILEQARYKGGERFHTKAALHLTEDGRAVGENDPAGRFVLVGPGGDISLALAKELGLLTPAPAEEAKPEADAPKPDELPAPVEETEHAEPPPVTEEKADAAEAHKSVKKHQASDKAIHKAEDK